MQTFFAMIMGTVGTTLLLMASNWCDWNDQEEIDTDRLNSGVCAYLGTILVGIGIHFI